VIAPEPNELVLTPPAVRAIQRSLPEPLATAALEFLTGALVAKPLRVGRPLRGDLAGVHSARRGTYRVLYRINNDLHEVIVLRIDRRRVVYRGSSKVPFGRRQEVSVRLAAL
jgi:mRNA interferase RelE/StbE